EDAGIVGLLRRTGYLRLYRSGAALAQALAADAGYRERYGVNFRALKPQEIGEIEPYLKGPNAGGVLMPDPASVADPGAVCKAYARRFCERGGRFLAGDARTLVARPGGWQVDTAEGRICASAAVIALGPWSGDVARNLGYSLPLGVKRGYHLHFLARGNATLNRPVLDAENGYAMAPMMR